MRNSLGLSVVMGFGILCLCLISSRVVCTIFPLFLLPKNPPILLLQWKTYHFVNYGDDEYFAVGEVCIIGGGVVSYVNFSSDSNY